MWHGCTFNESNPITSSSLVAIGIQRFGGPVIFASPLLLSIPELLKRSDEYTQFRQTLTCPQRTNFLSAPIDVVLLADDPRPLRFSWNTFSRVPHIGL
ncbi:MAG: hypothetical protein DRP09_06690 [Candidatus Thorarchaeota archaeon]|nr:MAG: hypothetical protein DRP09_06690 [Candidatus Thorarchaeota archaeon]